MVKGSITADELFAELDMKYPKNIVCLGGLRARENLTQVQFAYDLNISQSYLSLLERGERPITEKLDKRIESIFEVSYNMFCEEE